jgi:hypothetical protein
MFIAIGIILYALLALAWSRIFRRMGWNPWWGVTLVVPFAFFVISGVLYFQQWPLERRVVELEEELARLQGHTPERHW